MPAADVSCGLMTRQVMQSVLPISPQRPGVMVCVSTVVLQAGSPLPGLPKGAAITLSNTLDLQQSNPMHYKSTDETAKFERVREAHRAHVCPTAEQSVAEHQLLTMSLAHVYTPKMSHAVHRRHAVLQRGSEPNSCTTSWGMWQSGWLHSES